ncbi:hypothetical protein [Natronorubrum aibiense]|nr:hypothetical protein [Natronorubrum aibiense]
MPAIEFPEHPANRGRNGAEAVTLGIDPITGVASQIFRPKYDRL